MKNSAENSVSLSQTKNASLQALRQMKQLRDAQKRNLTHPYDLGLKLMQIKDFGKAAEAFQQAIAENSDFSFAHFGLGEALYELNKINEAEVSFTNSIKLNPLHAPSYCGLADIMARRGKFAEAVEIYRKTLELQPDSIKAVVNLAEVLSKSSTDGKNEALEIFRRAIEHNPRNLEIYRAALDFFSPDAELYVELGEKLAKQNLTYMAVLLFRLATNLSADSSKIWLRLTEILKENNDSEAAEICLQRAVAG
jgi:tetratricopeptide (TPR) repeat protein